MYYVYLLRSKKYPEQTYKGYTEDLKTRLAEREAARGNLIKQYRELDKKEELIERSVERFNGAIVELKSLIEEIENSEE